ncbi:MAG TPA: dihydrolipoamide acetyltransferase family protein [Roseiarcus sp.]|nr:dihydrolipoamide acetyltransferase family protein [Roseiarcus sp.]
MPALGADMEAGTLAEWHVKVGDRVRSGDIVAVVETQKGAIDVEIFLDGVVSKLLVGEGQRVPVGTVLAEVNGTGAAQPAPAPPIAVAETVAGAPPAPPAPQPSQQAAEPVLSRALATPSGPPAPAGARLRVTPAARRRAAAIHVELSNLKGTGVEGAIRLADVDAAASRPAPAPPAKKGLDLAEMRKAIAAAMARSKREIPHYYLTETVDLSPAIEWLERFNLERPPPERILPAVLFLKASALALREWPQFNGAYENGAFTAAPAVHVGWAIALRGGGLIAPAIRDADQRPLSDLMAAMRDLVERARRGGLRSSELTSPTVTITNVGDRGAETVTGIIYPPQVALVGFGRAALRPWVVDGRVEPRMLVNLSLAADHRVTDGHIGGLFLVSIARRLQEPKNL